MSERIDKLKSLLASSPQDSFLQHALALEYIKLGNDNDARVLFEAILARESSYTGSYYHLAKLLERNGLNDEAIKIYEQGMEACKMASDNHAYNELKAAYEELIY